MTAQAILSDLATRGIRVWAESDRLKLDAPIGVLTDEDKAKLAAHKSELLNALTTFPPGTCPGCRAPMNLQNRNDDLWWCSACRLFARSDGRLLPAAAKTRPAYGGEIEARRLVEELQAVGCGFVFDDGELRITNISRVSLGLWARLENAGAFFLSAARQAAESLQEEEGTRWVH